MELNRIKIAQDLINTLKAADYLEIGVSKGDTLLSVNVKRKIGVDPKDVIGLRSFFSMPSGRRFWLKKIYRKLRGFVGFEKIRFFELTSDDFFARVPHIFSQNKIDVALIDGLHTYDQVLRDVENTLKYLSVGGVIIMHDCNPVSEAMGVPASTFEEAEAKRVPGWDGLWCGDVWKAIVHLRSKYADLNVFVLDCDMGVGIVSRGKPQVKLSYGPEDIQRLTYADLENQRRELLNLKPPAYFQDFLKTLKPVV